MKSIRFCLSLIAMLTTLAVSADEGMWLVQAVDAPLYGRMRHAGLRLPLSQIYNPGKGGLTDAVVAVNGGMGSGSMISSDGLMITNHHVAYSGICAVTSPEHNRLRDGFWASSREEELPLEGYSVQFLRGVEDVTAEADSLRRAMVAEGTWSDAMGPRRLAHVMEERYAAKSEYTPSLESMWGGKRYCMYYYETFRDVRLVAAPPERLGAFGGDVDNWGWTQHKADFTVMRVYCDREGKPAEYSADNVPLHPSRWLKVASKPLKEGDFTMILGYPGTTHRYMSSWAVAEKRDIHNPITVDARTLRLNIMREGMERSDTVRINYSDRYFGLSNYADYARWENKCLYRYDVEKIRRAEENDMREWIESDSARKAEYGGLFDRLARGYEARREAIAARWNYAERWFGVSEALLAANRLQTTVNQLKQKGEYMVDVNDERCKGIRAASERLHKADPATDRRLFVEVGASFIGSIPESYWTSVWHEKMKPFGGDARAMLEWTYDNSICSSAERLDAFFSEPKRIKTVMNDPMLQLSSMLPFQPFMRRVVLAEKSADASVSSDERTYASLVYDYRDARGIAQYPNANSTMRITYGNICPLTPRDGVRYDWQSTTTGYIEKIDDSTHEFRSDERMVSLISALKRPRRVDFLTDNDITGGNSGSAVLNARGEIIGLAFDGNRESMAGDIWFNPGQSRTVCVDMDYVMWILENYAPASLTKEIRGK